MSTRAFVGYVEGQTVTAACSHYDGYPVGLGRVLAENYNTPEKAQETCAIHDVMVDCHQGVVQPFPTGDDTDPMILGWKDLVLEMAHSDAQYAYLFIPGQGWMGTQLYRDWKIRVREAKNKGKAIREDKLRFQSLPRMVRNQDAAIRARLR